MTIHMSRLAALEGTVARRHAEIGEEMKAMKASVDRLSSQLKASIDHVSGQLQVMEEHYMDIVEAERSILAELRDVSRGGL